MVKKYEEAFRRQAVVLVGATLYLSSRGFTLLHAAFLGFLMMACLAARRHIGEKTFGPLLKILLKRDIKDA